MRPTGWHQPSARPETMWIRDDGHPGFAGEQDEDGKLKINPLTRLPEGFRLPAEAWPEDAFVKIKSSVSTRDFDMIQQYIREMRAEIEAQTADEEKRKKLTAYWTPIINAAVMMRGVKCNIGQYSDCSNVFEDVTTRQMAEEETVVVIRDRASGDEVERYTVDQGDTIPGTGQLLQVPLDETSNYDHLDERIESVKELISGVIAFIAEEVQRLLNDPLPGSKPVSASSDGSGSPKTRKSGSSSRSK